MVILNQTTERNNEKLTITNQMGNAKLLYDKGPIKTNG
jgi:hypothetical protein